METKSYSHMSSCELYQALHATPDPEEKKRILWYIELGSFNRSANPPGIGGGYGPGYGSAMQGNQLWLQKSS